MVAHSTLAILIFCFFMLDDNTNEEVIPSRGKVMSITFQDAIFQERKFDIYDWLISGTGSVFGIYKEHAQ